jgi:amidohydrolase
VRALNPDVASVHASAVTLRRVIHASPETAFEEVETARIVAERMKSRGLTVRTGLGKTGVAAVLDTGRDGPTVLLRADLDALPLAEKTGLPFASQNGRMHACGHDGHVAALDAVADLLILEPPARGRVVLAFQPGEEGAGGAAAMIAAGVLDDPKPDVVFGVHLWAALPLGTVGIAPGPMMAAVDEFRIEVRGPGGHAASPHETRDPVVGAAQVITALQTIASRRISPMHPVVVSVTSVHGGSAFNILPEAVVLRGTCRAFDKEVVRELPLLVEAIAAKAAATAGCEAATVYRRVNRALVNRPDEADRCARVVEGILGGRVSRDCRTMGGEDFSEFLGRVPGAFAFVGATAPESGSPRIHHSPTFDFDERAIAISSRLLAAYARDAVASPTRA